MTISIRISLILILGFQSFLATKYELSHDEAYYWMFSQRLDWGFFDHPPMVAAIIRIFSFLPKSELSVRLGFLILQYLTIHILLKLIPTKNHWMAVVLFFIFPLASFGGLFALPDMPLLFATALFCLILKGFLEEKPGYVWQMGLVIPLLLYSKYHGILIIFFTILAVPKMLIRKDFWITALISTILFSPHLWWQYQHDFATLRYHFFERPKVDFSYLRLFEYVGIQIGLAGVFVGPVVWWIAAKFKPLNAFDRAMKWIAFGVIMFFFFSTFSKKFEANWTIFLAIPLIYIVAASEYWKSKRVRRLLFLSICLVLPARLLLILPPREGLTRLTEFHGWKFWSQEMKKICGKNRKILANSYQIASKLSFYTNESVMALNYRSRKNQFDYWNFADEYSNQEVCYLTDKPEFSGIEFLTPAEKRLKFVLGFTIEDLVSRKQAL